MFKISFTMDGKLVLKGLTASDISSVSLHGDKRYIGIIVNNASLLKQLEEHNFNVTRKDENRADNILYASIYWSDDEQKRRRNPKIAINRDGSQTRIRTEQDFEDLRGVHFEGVDLVARSFEWKDDPGHRGTAVIQMIITPAQEELFLDFDEGLFDDGD